MRSASSARLVDVATSVIGIDVKDGLVDGAFGDVGAGVEGGGSGGEVLPQEYQQVQQEEVVVVDAVGVLQDVVVQPQVYWCSR